MARASHITSHPARKEMEKLYLTGQSVHSIAKQFQVDYQCLYRHLTSNVSGLTRQMSKAMEMKSDSEGSELLDLFTGRMEQLIEKLDSAIDDTKQDKDYVVMVSAIHELRQVYESQAKFVMISRQSGLPTEENKQFEKQQAENEYREQIKVLSREELKVLCYLQEKVQGLPTSETGNIIPSKPVDEDGWSEDGLVLGWVLPDNVEDVEPIEEDNVPLTKEPRLKRTKPPLKQDIEVEEEQSIPVLENTDIPAPQSTSIPSGRGSKLNRFKLGRAIRQQQDEQHGIGGSQGGASLPFSQDPGPIQERTDRQYRDDNAPNAGNPFDRNYKDD